MSADKVSKEEFLAMVAQCRDTCSEPSLLADARSFAAKLAPWDPKLASLLQAVTDYDEAIAAHIDECLEDKR